MEKEDRRHCEVKCICVENSSSTCTIYCTYVQYMLLCYCMCWFHRKPERSEVDDTLESCPYCQFKLPSMRLDCPQCKNHLPFCILTVITCDTYYWVDMLICFSFEGQAHGQE